MPIIMNIIMKHKLALGDIFGVYYTFMHTYIHVYMYLSSLNYVGIWEIRCLESGLHETSVYISLSLQPISKNRLYLVMPMHETIAFKLIAILRDITHTWKTYNWKEQSLSMTTLSPPWHMIYIVLSLHLHVFVL